MASTINKTAHGLTASTPFKFANVFPDTTGIDETDIYYVLASGLTADAFEFSETDGGAAFTLATDITEGDVYALDTYPAVSGTVMDGPTAVPTPDAPVLSSALVSGIVRLYVTVATTPQAKVRIRQVQVTSRYVSADDVVADPTLVEGDPYWGANPTSITLPESTTVVSIPALGSTVYVGRVVSTDVYGNESAASATHTHTTLAGGDALQAALSDLANDVTDGVITETKIADDSISTVKLKARAITAELLAAELVLTSLLKTSTAGSGIGRVELDVDGIRLYDNAEALTVRIPTDGTAAYFKGRIEASNITNSGTTELADNVALTGDGVMTLANGVSAPTVAPGLTASVDSTVLATPTGSIAAAAGIAYDSGATSYWVACDPTVSPYYVAQEFLASTGALIRSIPATGSSSTVTATLGSSTHVTDGANGRDGSTASHIATPLTIPSGLSTVKVTKVAIYLAGHSGSAQVRNCIWNDVSGAGNVLGYSDVYTAADEGATGLGDSILYNKPLTAPEAVTSGATYYFGAYHTSASEGFQWDYDSGSSKSTYLGNGTTSDGTGWALYSSSQKPNVYITYTHVVDTRLETAPNIGIATDGTHVYTLDNTGVIWKYLRADMSYVAKSSVQTGITGTKSKAGLFYDATATELIITTTTGTGAGVYPRFVRVSPSTLAVSTAFYDAATGSTFSGTTDTFRGGARLVDPLNASAATYWLATTSAVYAYTYATTVATNVANRNFGQSTTMGDGLTHDGTVFRGWDSASPTKVWQFSAWDWTAASSVYWVGYAWYDPDGTTHETVCGLRTSITMRRREQLSVSNAAIPGGGGADEPDNVRTYMAPGASNFVAGGAWLQSTDALTARTLVTYTSSGTADFVTDGGGRLVFPTGTPAQLKSAATGWTLVGDGSATLGLTATGGKPPVVNVFTTANDGVGAWTVPAGLSYIVVEVVGGGGAGAGGSDAAASQGNFGGGGGGGGYARKLLTAAALAGDTAYDITIANATAGGATTGGAGGTCIFAGNPTAGALTVQATGGGGGTVMGSGTSVVARGGGAGGVGSGGDVNAGGGTGQFGLRISGTDVCVGGGGGNSVLGGGGIPQTSASGATSNDGANGNAYGGGGGGGTSNNGGDGTTFIGGDGAVGVVIVTEYYI